MTAVDSHYALQLAVKTVLAGNAELVAIVGTRIYDDIPESAQFPYVTLGDGHKLATPADLYRGADNKFNVHVWGRRRESSETKQLGAIVEELLDGNDGLPVDASQRVTALFHEETVYIDDPDGLTLHVVIMFTAFTEPS